MTTDTNQSTEISGTPFTTEETRALEAVRDRYKSDRDLFSPHELARLDFLRWRVDSGRLRP